MVVQHKGLSLPVEHFVFPANWLTASRFCGKCTRTYGILTGHLQVKKREAVIWWCCYYQDNLQNKAFGGRQSHIIISLS